MSALREVFARFAIEMDTAPIDRGNDRIGSMVGTLQNVGAAISANLVFQRAREFVVGIQAAGDSVNDLTAIMGINSAELQQWRYAAQLAGIDAGEFDGSFLRLQNRMAQGGSGAAVFRRLGVEIRNADGSLRNASDVLTDLADPIAAIGSDAERTGVLVDLLGRSGARMGPLFTQGSEGIGRVREEFQALGGGLSEEAVAGAASLGDAWDRLDVVALSLKSRLAVFLLPALEAVSDAMQTMATNTSIVEASIPVLIVVLGHLAVASAATWGPMALAAARALFPILLAVIVIDDLITMFRGGDSVIGTFMDTLGGDGTQLAFVNALTEAWKELVDIFRSGQQAIVSVTNALGLGETAANEMTAGGEIRTNVRGLPRDANGDPITDEGVLRGRRSQAFSPLTALGASAPVTVTNSPSIQIDARGMDPVAIQAIVTRALANANAASNQDTLDALTGGAVE